LGRIATQEQGQTLVEYGILVSVIAIVVVVVAVVVGLRVSAMFEEVIHAFS
jgi:Flp pilus assembly pilin Flp